jgi:hypothetical protein
VQKSANKRVLKTEELFRNPAVQVSRNADSALRKDYFEIKGVFNMKKIFALGLALTMILSMLAGCSKTLPAKTPEELNKLYTAAISANGGEMV